MTIYINNHSFHYEIEKLVRLFFPNEKLTVLENTAVREMPYIDTVLENAGGTESVFVSIRTDDFSESARREIDRRADDPEKNAERTMAAVLYELLVKMTGRPQPWGILTGVRPIKLFRRFAEKNGTQYAKDFFRNQFFVSEEKTDLCALTETYEKKILSLSRPDSFSLYVSIPFCPSRCSYCSFVSQSIAGAEKLIQPYFDLLCREIAYTADIVRQHQLRLESVYIGGGTPTTLNARQLFELIGTIKQHFDMSTCREFTVEAGRPDTIDEEKLTAILNGGVDRISINPQTLNDEVLKIIGRKHTAAQMMEAYRLARNLGFRHINTDLIAGLPGDSTQGFIDTLDRICEMNPESITVHTLSMKRSSNLTKQGTNIAVGKESQAAAMLRYCEKKLTECAYHPYYLYRQTRMEGNLENVGWSKEGYDGIYNVYVMDETHTVLGCGAGAVSKLKDPRDDSLKRIFNYKYPYEYINGFDEMLNRKQQVINFYDELSEYLSQVCV